MWSYGTWKNLLQEAWHPCTIRKGRVRVEKAKHQMTKIFCLMPRPDASFGEDMSSCPLALSANKSTPPAQL